MAELTVIERFSNECRKTKTKVITLSNHKGHKTQNESIINCSKYKRSKTRANKSRLVLVLRLIG